MPPKRGQIRLTVQSALNDLPCDRTTGRFEATARSARTAEIGARALCTGRDVAVVRIHGRSAHAHSCNRLCRRTLSTEPSLALLLLPAILNGVDREG